MRIEVALEVERELLKLAGGLCNSRTPLNSPNELFHYTDLQGFVGIVTSQSLWASDMLCLEDASEATYAYQVIENTLNHDDPPIPQIHLSEFLKVLKGEASFWECAPHVSCFCEDGDLLEQWRGYGGRGEGLAVAFKVPWLSSLRRSGFFLWPVLYRRDRQEELVSKYVQGAVDLFTRRQFAEDDAREFWRRAAQAATDLIIVIKDPAFETEREWRLVNPGNIGDKDLKFRQAGSRIIPYIAVPIEPEAITGVIRGPHFAGTDTRGAEYMLLFNEFTEASIRIRDSRVPIRK
jgi:hypothetical protein